MIRSEAKQFKMQLTNAFPAQVVSTGLSFNNNNPTPKSLHKFFNILITHWQAIIEG